MRVARFALPLLLVRCFAEPDYEGRQCSLEVPCPPGLRCGADGTCRTPCRFGEPCDDGNACTLGDQCDELGTCTAVAMTDCNDGNLCTDDVCDPAVGCVYTANSAPCDDGDACTSGDSCSEGVCSAGAPIACNDGNPCTDDGCDPKIGCVFENNTSACNDANPCTTGDVCGDASCGGTGQLDCDDGNDCTSDGCDPITGCTRADVPDGSPCTFATGGIGSCSRGLCTGCSGDADCDDGNVCTDDVCDAGTCTHASNTAACNDDNPCTHRDRCSPAGCVGTPISCVSDACVARACNGTATCTEVVNAGARCAADGNPCTNDVCDGAGNCTHPPVRNGVQCGVDPSNRCCDGNCVNLTFSEANCGGCNSACDPGFTCEGVGRTDQCGFAPMNTSGRCRCSVDQDCPRGQVCRQTTPYAGRCSPLQDTACAPNQTVRSVNNCPNFCWY